MVDDTACADNENYLPALNSRNTHQTLSCKLRAPLMSSLLVSKSMLTLFSAIKGTLSDLLHYTYGKDREKFLTFFMAMEALVARM